MYRSGRANVINFQRNKTSILLQDTIMNPFPLFTRSKRFYLSKKYCGFLLSCDRELTKFRQWTISNQIRWYPDSLFSVTFIYDESINRGEIDMAFVVDGKVKWFNDKREFLSNKEVLEYINSVPHSVPYSLRSSKQRRS